MTYLSIGERTNCFAFLSCVVALLAVGGTGCSDKDSDAVADSVRSHRGSSDSDTSRHKPDAGASDSDSTIAMGSAGHSGHSEPMAPEPMSSEPTPAPDSAHPDEPSHASAGSSGGSGGMGGSAPSGDMMMMGSDSAAGSAGNANGHMHAGHAGSGGESAGSSGTPAAGGGGSAGNAGASGSAGEPAGGTGGVGGSDATSGTGGSAGNAGSGGDGGAGAAGEPATMGDHCADGEMPSAADAALTGKPDYWTDSMGRIDLVLPKGVLDWMGARVWEPSHDAWHNIRRCSSGSTIPRASSEICTHTELVPASQECSGPDDGYQFLVMHRHMIQALKQAFPSHTELFQGFPHFPFTAEEVPEEWRDRFGTGWSQTIINTATTLEDIENKLDQFPTEGSVGQFIQCGGMGTITNIHGALHFKWVVSQSPYSLGKQTVNIDNYMFWKLHGWIDSIWERYRVAKGLAPDEPALKEALVQQCHEMHALGVAVGGMPVTPPPPPVVPTETGLFVDTVRPIFDEICSGCHSESSPEAGMSLGGQISSSAVVSNLVNIQAMHGGQYQRIVPGAPDQSWLYLKVSGLAATAGCTGTACNPQTMPPTGQVTLTQAQLDAIRTWIEAGAPAPTAAQ